CLPELWIAVARLAPVWRERVRASRRRFPESAREIQTVLRASEPASLAPGCSRWSGPPPQAFVWMKRWRAPAPVPRFALQVAPECSLSELTARPQVSEQIGESRLPWAPVE